MDADPERTMDAAQLVDLLAPAKMEHYEQPLFLFGHHVGTPANGITATKNTSTLGNSRQ